jgi:hypothetical protein
MAERKGERFRSSTLQIRSQERIGEGSMNTTWAPAELHDGRVLH